MKNIQKSPNIEALNDEFKSFFNIAKKFISQQKKEKEIMIMKQQYNFYKGTGDWEKLFDFLDKNDFTILDFLSCICANLLKEPEKIFKTHLSVGGQIFKISIEKVKRLSE